MNFYFFLPLALVLKFASAREPFPKDEAFDDPEVDTFQPYLQDLFIYSAGAGVGLLVPFCLLMSLCWLTNCCRNKKKKIEPQNEEGKEDDQSDQLKKPKKKGSFKSYLFSSIFLFLAFVAIAFGIYGTTGDATKSTVDILEGTEDFVDGTASLLCREQESLPRCNSGLGGFLSDANESFVEICDQTIDFIEDIRGILDQINDTRIEIEDLGDVIEVMSDITDDIISNVTDANQRITYVSSMISNGGYSFSSSLPDPNDFPDVTDDDTESLQDAIYGVGNASNYIQNIWDEMNATLAEALDPLEARLDGRGTSGDDDRLSTIDIFNNIEEQLFDASKTIFEGKDVITEARVDVEDNDDTYVNYITIFFFIPAIILLLVTLCMSCCYKKGGRAPLFANMCFNYAFILPYCVIPGIILLFALINEDVCDVHMDILVEQLNDTVLDFGDSRATLGETVESILTCSGTQDLVTIMGFQNELNITDDLSSTLDSLNEATDGISSATDSLNGTFESMEDLIDALNVDFISSSDLTAAKEDVVSLLDSLPDQNANLDSSEQRTKFNSMYGVDWDAYQDLIDDVNAIIVAMTPSNPLGGKVGFGNATTYTQSYFAADDNFACTGSCSGSSTNNGAYSYGGSDTYSDLDTASGLLDASTTIVQEVVSINDDIVYNLTLVLKDINAINASILLFPDLQDDASNEYNDIDDALSTIGDGIDIEPITDAIEDIIDQVMNANVYTQCAFIGTYYTGTYLGSYCDDLIPSLITLGYLMVGNALVMFVTFCMTGYYAPYRRKDKSILGPGQGNAEYTGYEAEVELGSMPMDSDAPPGFSRKL